LASACWRFASARSRFDWYSRGSPLALSDDRPFLEVNSLEIAADPRSQVDRLDRLREAGEAVEIDDCLKDRPRDRDRRRWGLHDRRLRLPAANRGPRDQSRERPSTTKRRGGLSFRKNLHSFICGKQDGTGSQGETGMGNRRKCVEPRIRGRSVRNRGRHSGRTRRGDRLKPIRVGDLRTWSERCRLSNTDSLKFFINRPGAPRSGRQSLGGARASRRRSKVERGLSWSKRNRAGKPTSRRAPSRKSSRRYEVIRFAETSAVTLQ